MTTQYADELATPETVARALTEPMVVDEADPAVPDDAVSVYSEDRQYVVTEAGECSCPDYKYRRAPRDEACKHGIIALVSLGQARIPEWANEGAIDDQLRRRLQTQEVHQ